MVDIIDQNNLTRKMAALTFVYLKMQVSKVKKADLNQRFLLSNGEILYFSIRQLHHIMHVNKANLLIQCSACI